MDQRMEKICKDMQENALGLDESFTFRCRACGKCCKNRHDILLTPRDLYNICLSLGRTPQYIVERYCETYIGESSGVPLVRLNAVGHEQACPFLRNKRCVIHKHKPVVCALFPLGRSLFFENEEENADVPEEPNIVYFNQNSDCGGKEQIHTVRDWLSQFGLAADDEFFILWTKTLKPVAELCARLEAHSSSNEESMDIVWGLVFAALYLEYDTEKELIPQFRENADELLDILRTVTEKVEAGKEDEHDG